MTDLRTAAVEYVAHGWHLVPLPAGRKGPALSGWQIRDNTVSTVERASAVSGGIGLAHAYSGTCALDIDSWDDAGPWLQERGVQLDQLWNAPDAVKILSGRPGRGKLLYRVPFPLRTVQPPDSGLELRCASSSGTTVQDVLPPTIHPDTGQPYLWGGDWHALPEIPSALLALWIDLIDSPVEDEQSAEPVGMSEEHQRAVLASLDANCGYAEWIRIGMALHHENSGGDDGFNLWDEWSAAGHSYPGPDQLRKHWDSFGRGSGPVVTMRSLGTVATAVDFEELEDDEPERFEFIPAPKFAKRSEPGWIVKGVLPKAGLAVVYGDSASGKTFVVIDIVGSIVRGVPWRGHRTKKSTVAYIVAEGSEFFSRRIKAYEQEVGPLDGLFVCADSPNFLNDNDHKLVARALRDINPDLIVVDTLARAMPGGAENSSEDMGRVIARCEWLHRKTGAMVLLVHHSGKDAARGARGWSGLRAAADAELLVTRDRENDRRAVEVGKQKDSADGAAYPFKLLAVPLGYDADGDVVTSCVVVEPPADLSV